MQRSRVLRDDVFPLMRMDDITHFPKAGGGLNSRL